MVFTESTQKYFLLIPFKIRAAMARDNLSVPFAYENEPFFTAYQALYQLWVKRQPQKTVVGSLRISKNALKKWEDRFTGYGAIGLLPKLSFITVDPRLEKLKSLLN